MDAKYEVVGHKTFFENGKFRHEPLTRAEADAAHESWERSEKRRQELMPTEQDAINVLFDAWYRLTKDFGWKGDPRRRMPKDGTQFIVLELGSSGQHICHRDEIGFWVSSDGDLWPSDPVLFKARKDGAP